MCNSDLEMYPFHNVYRCFRPHNEHVKYIFSTSVISCARGTFYVLAIICGFALNRKHCIDQAILLTGLPFTNFFVQLPMILRFLLFVRMCQHIHFLTLLVIDENNTLISTVRSDIGLNCQITVEFCHY